MIKALFLIWTIILCLFLLSSGVEAAEVTATVKVEPPLVVQITDLSYLPVPYDPTTGSVMISSNLSKPASVSLRISDMFGSFVNLLGPFPGSLGPNFLFWDGKNFAGRLVEPASYFYSVYATDGLTSDERTQVMIVSTSTGVTNATFAWGSAGAGDISIVGDFNADDAEDVAIFQPSAAQWHFNWAFTSATNNFINWGLVGDYPLVGDFNGDGIDDIGVFRPSTGQWHFNWGPSYDFVTNRAFHWGMPGDTPLVGDFDGDGLSNVALRRSSSAQWFFNMTFGSDTDASFRWGNAGLEDIPIISDFDGNGSDDVGIFRPSAAQWYFKWDFSDNSTNNFINWGLVGDYPLVGDFNGDGIDDIGVFRPSTGQWYFNWGPSYDSLTDHAFQWGMPGDTPLVGDFDGNNRTDVALRRSSTAQWFFNWSSLP